MTRLPQTDSFLWQNVIESSIGLGIEHEQESDSSDASPVSDAVDIGGTGSEWSNLPDILLEKVFSLLSLKARYHSSMVCKHWYDVFYSPSIWRKLVMSPSSFTHQRYTPYKGNWSELSHHKVQMCLKKVGAFVHTIQIDPIPEFYNLYEFLRIVNVFMEFYQEDSPMGALVNVYFTFCCEGRERSEVYIYGTGGKLLAELKRFLKNLNELEELKVNHLLLDLSDAPGVLDHVVNNCSYTLKYLELRNFTKELYPMFIAGMFPNLQTLVLSPQHLSPDIVKRLGHCKVTNLHIVQDHYCGEEAYIIDKEVWLGVREKSPSLNVHLSARGSTPLDINFQEGAPVTSIIYTTKYSKIHPLAIETITYLYDTSLQVYGHFDLPRYHGRRSFPDRCDTNLVSLVRLCPKMHTLIVRERISTSTLIILAREGKSLRRLYVRRNAILKRCDWQRTLTWDDDYYWSMRRASHSYEETFMEVSRCLGFQWQPMTDTEFKRLKSFYCDTNTAQSDFDTS